ncbi:metacaspase-9-like [Prosopis cineraria]|uniref:metacaspase-9-like n=1 Tax=Prosopis cineraria TaxID=364024 RepID=UPI00240F9D08|nr:metacaspase-9-like [Prosopis cineraria]
MEGIRNSKRLAVLVGCNYPDTPNELHGCINDVLAMRDTLINRFGFEPSNIELLTDVAPAGSGSGSGSTMPTGANIKLALARMVDQAQEGDVLYFHYSGHGTRISSMKPGFPFRREEEAIVPCDFNLITDLDLRQLVNRVPKRASLTILSDSCHSGGLIDKEKEQIGPSSVVHKDDTVNLTTKPKTIPFSAVLQHLSSLTNISSSDVGTHLLEFFGSEASLRFRLPFVELDLFQTPKPDDGILLSGCQADETSADMDPAVTGGKAYGAFSNAVQMVLVEDPAPLSNREIVVRARKILQSKGFEQHPCLYCSDENADATFLWQQPQASAL